MGRGCIQKCQFSYLRLLSHDRYIYQISSKTMYDKTGHSAISCEIQMQWRHPTANKVHIKWQLKLWQISPSLLTYELHFFTDSVEISFCCTINNNKVFFINIRRKYAVIVIHFLIWYSRQSELWNLSPCFNGPAVRLGQGTCPISFVAVGQQH